MKKYDGLRVDNLKHLTEVSIYNHNFYEHDGRLLFGLSDDDNTTEWFELAWSTAQPIYIGESYTSERPEVIHVYERR